MKEEGLTIEKGGAAGLCRYGKCKSPPKLGRARCSEHLLKLRIHARTTRDERRAKGLCLYCGKWPQFWGVKCIFCRQRLARHHLPRGARKALRIYREQQEKRVKEQAEESIRLAALGLLQTRSIRGRNAEALRLYVGDETEKKRRAYSEVGQIMGVSRERVRQLLSPSKQILASQLSNRGGWPDAQDAQLGEERDANNDAAAEEICASCSGIELTPVYRKSYAYRYCLLHAALLEDLNLAHCPACDQQSIFVPNPQSLRKELAKFLILKSGALTGSELRFLRACCHSSTLEFSAHLGVTATTIRNWENSQFLNYTNDLATRMTVSGLLGIDAARAINNRLIEIRKRTLTESEVSFRWVSSESKWLLSPAGERKAERLST